jgi:hypothetical protein
VVLSSLPDDKRAISGWMPAHHGIKSSPGAGDGGPVAGPHQKVHVIDLPGEPEENVAKLHSKLQSHLKK